MSVKKSEQCSECSANPRYQHHKKLLLLCVDCYREGVVNRLRVRKMTRVLEIGKPLEFSEGEGWRVGYLIKFGSYNDAHIQPVGAIGRVPDITSVKLTNVRQATCGSPSMPTVEDFYRKMKRPVLLVATPQKSASVVAQAAEYAARIKVTPAVDGKTIPVVMGIDLASGPDRAVTFQKVTERCIAAVQKSQAFTEHEQPKKVNKSTGDKIEAGKTYGLWTTIEYTGHSRWSCVGVSGEKKIVYAAELKAARGIVAAAASI